MADKVKVTLLRPLNGAEIGSEAEYSEADVKRLEGRGAVQRKSPKNKIADASKNKSDDLPALSSMTKDELIAQAEAEGVDLSDASNNDERREAIEKARG